MYGKLPAPRRERGAILVVSMLLLLVMTVLALTASQATRMEERMAGNTRELDLAFQAGEAGVRGAEMRIDSVIAPKRRGSLICSDRDTCDAVGRPEATQDYSRKDQGWWNANGYALTQRPAQLQAEPQYVIEQWADVPDTLTMGSSMQKSGTMYYVVAGRALGPTQTAVAILETSYAVRY
jgi:type IV pilus assembly protein PilX